MGFKKPDDSVKLRKIKAAKSSSKRPKANGVVGRPIGKEVSGEDEKQLVDDSEIDPIVDVPSKGRERSNSTPMSPKAEVAKSSKKRKEKKKKRKKKKKDGKDVDLKVEEAVDVTDIFPTQTKTKKRKSANKKKKKRKKTSD